MRFEQRLARTTGVLLGWGLSGGLVACVGETPTKTDTDSGTTPDLGELCNGATPPADYQLATGFVTVAPGDDCPDATAAQLEVLGCTFLEWQHVTCAFTEVAQDQVFVDDGYGGYWANATTAPTTTTYVSPDVVDVCYYQGVFYLPPDHPTCGRPLLHEGRAVVAEVRSGPSSWSEGPAPIAVELSGAERALLGEYWLTAARLEHASVASFAHFALDLLRFGAPPELLAGAQRAGLDEIDHAQRCFALAGGYLGAAVGPGALGAGGLPPGAASLLEVAEALVREGCIGETLAALDAAARLSFARDPAVRATLEVILRDESAHAALAWRTLGWLLRQDVDGALRVRLAAVFAEERERWSTAVGDGEAVSPGARAHGLLSHTLRQRALARGWEDVILPAWASAAAA